MLSIHCFFGDYVVYSYTSSEQRIAVGKAGRQGRLTFSTSVPSESQEVSKSEGVDPCSM